MKNQKLLESILSVISQVKEDRKKLQQINDFLLSEIYEAPNADFDEIPENFKLLVREVADNLEVGMICFINGDTHETAAIPLEVLGDEDSENYELWLDVKKKVLSWSNRIKIEPLLAHESYEIMSDFVETVVKDRAMQKQLSNALGKRKPFANFKNVIEGTNYLEKWYEFKTEWLQRYVWNKFSGNF